MSRFGISDDKFIRGSAPMTKAEIRAITLSKLRLTDNHIIVDIGAGTGSITVECAINNLNGTVYAIERKEHAVTLIEQNVKSFELENVEIIKGLAPIDIPDLPKVDRVVIGGSGGQLSKIFNWLSCTLQINGVVVANCITLENTVDIIEHLKMHYYTDIEIVQASISKSKAIANLTMMLAQNPVYIISGVRSRKE